jgi:hypothetical protein
MDFRPIYGQEEACHIDPIIGLSVGHVCPAGHIGYIEPSRSETVDVANAANFGQEPHEISGIDCADVN